MIKQVIIVRKDLNMRRGKEDAQVAHASMKVYFDILQKGISDINIPVYTTDKNNSVMNVEVAEVKMKLYKSDPLYQWAFNPEIPFTKVVVFCNSELELLSYQLKAEQAGLPNALIKDNGQTEFKAECPKCLGRGFETFESEEQGVSFICKTCEGTGKVSEPTYTTLAIGPAYNEDIDKITGHLKLR